MSDLAPPRPNRRARRSVKRPGSKFTNPAMGNLRQLELASRGIIQQAIASADTAGPEGVVMTPVDYVLMVFTSESPANGLLPVEMRVAPHTICVRFVPRLALAQAMAQSVNEQAEQIAHPYPCGHWAVLLSTRDTSRFCCTRCDLKIEQESS